MVKFSLAPHENLRGESRIHQVVDAVVQKTKFEKVLYLYSSGGKGHILVKNALRDRCFSELYKSVKKALGEKYVWDQYFPNMEAFIDYCQLRGLFKEKDVLRDFLGRLGEKGEQHWDDAQKNGNIKLQEWMASCHEISRIVFALPVFIMTLFTLVRYNPDKVISTQIISNDAILLAVDVYNTLYHRRGRKKLNLHLYITDMPTDFSNHFFTTIKTLFRGQKKRLVLYTPAPLAGWDWKKKTGLSEDQIVILRENKLPVRLAFIDAIEKFKKKPLDPTRISILIHSREERELLEKIMGKEMSKDLKAFEAPDIVHYFLGEKDDAYFIMLGSQPTRSAVYKYFEQYVKMAQENPEIPIHLFLFTGKFENNSHITDCFYKEIVNYLQHHLDKIPKNLRIIPLSFQDGEQLVGLFARCHSITRSGGATCMELLVMNEVVEEIKANSKSFYRKPMRLIHLQLIKGRSFENCLPFWERGNFYYLKDKIGAALVCPETLLNVLAHNYTETTSNHY